MKKILSTALAVALFIGTAQAQTKDDHKGRHHGKHGEIMKELELNAEQKEKIKNIREAQKKELQSLKADDKTEADKAAKKEIHEKYKNQIDAVLTAEQKEKIKKEKKDGHSDRLEKGDRKEKGREYAKELNLSADQKAKTSALNHEFKIRMDAVRNNSSLSNEEKKIQIKGLTETHKTNLKAILTPEQAEKMKSLQEGKHKNNKKEIR